MANRLNASGHVIHGALYMGTVGRLERLLFEKQASWRRMQHDWQSFHSTAAGRHVPRRVWMRHGALLEINRQH
jgi:hypothetical protein